MEIMTAERIIITCSSFQFLNALLGFGDPVIDVDGLLLLHGVDLRGILVFRIRDLWIQGSASINISHNCNVQYFSGW